MISAEFASNEEKDDAFLSLSLLFKPRLWKKGEALGKVKKNLRKKLFDDSTEIFFYLTGRSALYHLLQNLQFPAKSEILLQGFTCEAVVLPIIANRLKIVYVDIENKTLSMDINDLKKKITGQTKMLILQHTFGTIPLYRKEIIDFAKEKGIIILEDLAHGFDPQIKINDFALLSFGRSKALSSVFGGAIITKNKLVAQKLEEAEKNLIYPSGGFIVKLLIYKPLSLLIRNTYDIFFGKIIHFLTNKSHFLLPEITAKEKSGKFENLLDKAYPNALAILLNHQLKKFNQIRLKRAVSSSLYKCLIAPIYHQTLIINNTPIRFPLLIENRDEIINKAAQKNIYLGKWYDQPVAPKQLDLKRVGYSQGLCPTAESICKKIINLPTNISEEETKLVTRTLNDVIKI